MDDQEKLETPRPEQEAPERTDGARLQEEKELVKNRAASAKKVFVLFLVVWLAFIAFLAIAKENGLAAGVVFLFGVPFIGFIGLICSVAAMDAADCHDTDHSNNDHSNNNKESGKRGGAKVGFWLSLIAMLAGLWLLFNFSVPIS